MNQKNVKYIAKGLVYGFFWGGGEGAYQSKTIESSSMDDLTEKIMEGIEDGSLDDEMGYERLIGALMRITIKTTIVIDGEDYVNESHTNQFFGVLNEKQKKFLEENIFSPLYQ